MQPLSPTQTFGMNLNVSVNKNNPIKSCLERLKPCLGEDGSISLYSTKYHEGFHSSIGALTEAKEKFILSITENGYGKRTSHYDFRVTNRGGKGIIGIVNSLRNGNVSSSFPVNEGDEIMISTNTGRVIRVAVKEIRIAGRNTQGVRIIKLSGDEKVVSAIKIEDNLI